MYAYDNIGKRAVWHKLGVKFETGAWYEIKVFAMSLESAQAMAEAKATTEGHKIVAWACAST